MPRIIHEPSKNNLVSGDKFVVDNETTGTHSIDFDVIHNTFASMSSPAFTGTPTAPTASSGTNTTQIATTAFVMDAVSSVEPNTITNAQIDALFTS